MPFIPRRRAALTQVQHCPTASISHTQPTTWPDRSGSTKPVEGNLKKATEMLNPCSEKWRIYIDVTKRPNVLFCKSMNSSHLRLFIHTPSGQRRQNTLSPHCTLTSPTAAISAHHYMKLNHKIRQFYPKP